MLSDGDGFRQAFDWRGGSSLLPCFKHWNVLKKDSGLAHRRPGFVEIDCGETARFAQRSNEDLQALVGMLRETRRKVEAGTMTKARAEDVQKCTGLNYNADGMLACPVLLQIIDFPRVLTWDWCHNMLQDGTLSAEVNGLLRKAAGVGVKPGCIRDFLGEAWLFPAASQVKQKQLPRIFGAQRESASDSTQVLIVCACVSE